MCGEEAGSRIPVASVKGAIGHTLGAAGALEAIMTAQCLARDCVPATTGFSLADEACKVNVLTEPRYGYPQRVALSNSLGFGGHNASLAFAPWHSEEEGAA